MTAGTAKKAKVKAAPLVITVDVGNGYLKGVDVEGRRFCVPCNIKQLRPRETGRPDDNSELVIFDGERYAVGAIADQIGGKPLYSLGKAAYGHVAIAAAIAMSTPPTDAPIELRVLVPDSSKDEWAQFGAELPERLQRFTASGDRLYFPQFSSIRLVSEGLPVWEFVTSRKLIPEKFAGRLIGVIDAGTGDLTGYLFTQSGEVVRAGGASFMAPGLRKLIGDLADAINGQIVGSADRAVLMECIKTGNYSYPTANGSFDFSNLFDELVRLWRRELAIQIQTDLWADHWSRIGMVFIVGGASPLLKPLEDAFGDRFKVLTIDGISDPQVVNAYLLSQMA